MYRIMPNPFPGRWNFQHHPWLRDMHDSQALLNIGQKAAQVGFTETIINVTFFTLDIKGRDVLYVLPATTPDASNFSAGRFDPALELSPHLRGLFSDVKNVGHKRAGTRNLYIRGSHSRGGLKSVPVYLIILDEVNEMTQENIPLALERTSGQTDYMHWMVSTPTIDGVGINKYFKDSTQNHFFFPCPSCHRHIEFNFPDDLIITADNINDPRIDESHYVCNQCRATLHHHDKINYLNKGKWVPTYQGRNSEGWYVNQFYSMAASGAAPSVARLAISAQSNKADEQEFYNSKGGIVHSVEGSQVTDLEINNAIGSYTRQSVAPSGIITMGIDQGRWIHYVIDHWIIPTHLIASDLSADTHCRMLTYGKVLNFEQLDHLIRQFRVHFAVIDSQPERRKATEFANRFAGHVRLCFYPEGIHAKQIHISDSGGEPSVSVDRTTWLDTSLGRFRSRTITLPQDIDQEFRTHIKALTRVYSKDRWGNPIGRYVHGTNDDHYAHARNYSEIALHLATSMGHSKNIQRVF